VLWLTDEPLPDAETWWSRLHASRENTGLYPLLLEILDSQYAGARDRPWRDTGDLTYQDVATIDELDAETVLRGWWDPEENQELYGPDSPLALPWPGLAPPASQEADPDEFARGFAATWSDRPRLLGLAPSSRGADALTATGWQGPLNHTNDTQEISVVVRSWEERFGARVVMVGFDTLCLSIAAPPTTLEHARAVAAEHYAFCPDNLDQGPGDFDDYAKALIDERGWWFWWD